jgi:glycosyltransferase involved in cell wall biosynthesis
MPDADPPARPGARVGVVFQGIATDRSAWSGAPAGLFSGLEEAGAKPVAVDARAHGSERIGRALGMSWIARTTNPVFAAAGGRRADRALARLEAAAAVMIGSGFSLADELPIATFDDMTVVQALAQEGSEYEAVKPRQAERWRERQRRNFEAARACCVASEWAAKSVRDDYGIDPSKVHVVGLGANTAHEAIERDWSVPRFLFLGADWERKRGGAVLEAFAAVRERHPAATLDLIGEHPAVEAPGVRGHGLLALDSPAQLAERDALIAASTCLVLPSNFEPFGIAYLEAGRAGVPSIGTSRGGAATAVGDGGILVDPTDRTALGQAMMALCEPQTAQRLGERAFAHSADYSWRGVAERVLAATGVD